MRILGIEVVVRRNIPAYKLNEVTLNLRQLQAQVMVWTDRNFKDREGWMPVMGVCEEAGEMAHAYLKLKQGIRGTPEEHEAKLKDAAADVIIFCADVANMAGFDLSDVLTTTWEKVRERDWTKAPKGGKVDRPK